MMLATEIDLNIVMADMEKAMEQREVFLDNFQENVAGSRPISKTSLASGKEEFSEGEAIKWKQGEL